MKVTIIGSGLVGGSIGLSLKQTSVAEHIIAYDQDPSVATRAVERGAADAASASLEEAASDRDVIFIATPVGVISRVARDLVPYLSGGTLLTDVGSTKSRVVVEIEETLPEGVTFIGGHPMAGSEDEGIDAARPDLFKGAWWILTPTARSDADAYGRLNALVTTLGARVMALEPAEHDRLMAMISHLPQLTASALMNLVAEQGKDHGGLLALAAGGFRDVTRIAASNPEIWVDICRENGPAIVEALERMASELLHLRDLVEQDDLEALRHALGAARAARRSLPEREVTGALHDVRFPVPDRPGVLAEVTTVIGNLGVNIEDLRITHTVEGGRGTLHLSIVGEEGASRVVHALAARGYEAKAFSS
ncbi:MAG TPA: prephenate dehydrogenase/arogenate dehydrogenase family protein [Actinomycetota bacterium]